MKTIKYIRPGGREITLNFNEATKETAKRLKWKRVKQKPAIQDGAENGNSSDNN